MRNKFKKILIDYDPYLLFALATLCLIGLVGVYSATYKGGISPLFLKQGLYILAGWFIILLLSRLNFRIVFDMAPAIYFLNLFLLVLVPIAGKTVYGAKRWIDLGLVSIQPSELFKFSLLVFSLYTLSHTKRLISKESLILILAFAIPSLFTLKQPDLGTTITYGVILSLLLFLYGAKLKYFILSGLTFILLSPVLWHFLKDYQKERILAFIDPYEDYHGSGYQLIQSMIAVGSGGFLGKGFLQGTQSHLLFLPEKPKTSNLSLFTKSYLGKLSVVDITSLALFRSRGSRSSQAESMPESTLSMGIGFPITPVEKTSTSSSSTSSLSATLFAISSACKRPSLPTPQFAFPLFITIALTLPLKTFWEYSTLADLK